MAKYKKNRNNKESKGNIFRNILNVILTFLILCGIGYLMWNYFNQQNELNVESEYTLQVVEEKPAESESVEEDELVCTTYKTNIQNEEVSKGSNGDRIGWIYFPNGDKQKYTIFSSDMSGDVHGLLDYNGIVWDTDTPLPTVDEDNVEQISTYNSNYTPTVMLGHSYPVPGVKYPGSNILTLENNLNQHIIFVIGNNTYVMKATDYYEVGEDDAMLVYESEIGNRVRIYACTFAAPFVNTITGRAVGEFELVEEYTDCI